MKKVVAIIGGGPASFLLAAFLDPALFEIRIYERNKSLGRKFLVAGKGGFNLTHSEPIDQFIKRYSPVSFMKGALEEFNNEDLMHWLNGIGVPTYIGSSGRVYPERGIKPIEVLDTILKVLSARGVNFSFDQTWTGWDDEENLVFNDGTVVNTDIHVFALGGGSWKVTGSDGFWSALFSQKGINVGPFISSNCAYEVAWRKEFLSINEGRPLKNITMSIDHALQSGEVVITQFGLEGNAIYALSPQIQNALVRNNKAVVYIDLKPTLTEEKVLLRIQTSKLSKTTEILRRDLKMSAAQINILKEHITKEEFLSGPVLAKKIKALPITLIAAAPIDEAISTMGGIELDELTPYYELKKMRNTYCIGEMLDWNAPTGGYLLQAAFSMGVYLARHLNTKEF